MATPTDEQRSYVTWEDAAEWVYMLERATDKICIVSIHPGRIKEGRPTWGIRMQLVTRLTDEWTKPFVVKHYSFPDKTVKSVPALIIRGCHELEREATEKMMDAERQASF